MKVTDYTYSTALKDFFEQSHEDFEEKKGIHKARLFSTDDKELFVVNIFDSFGVCQVRKFRTWKSGKNFLIRRGYEAII